MKPIVLCGPTASGKTELALELARELKGIIISADSRQIYQHLTVGTAKPIGTWKNGRYWVEDVNYCLVDFLPVTQSFNAGNFCEQVRQLTQEFPHTPLIFAGGTGMYLHAYFVGMDQLPAGTPQTRATLEQLLAQQGKEGLHRALQAKDPISAAQIPIGNVQRTMRALELCWLTGQPASTLKSGKFFQLPDEKQSYWVYLDWEKEILRKRIAARTANMMEGMIAETRSLLNAGFPPTLPAFKSVGYPQILALLDGHLSAPEAQERICTLTCQYAKRQRTWFNRYTNAHRLTFKKPADWDPPRLARNILSEYKK